MSSSVSALFQSLHVGTTHLHHRITMAPRLRANKDHVHPYTQRSNVPGTLIISEATLIAPQVAGYANVPGIWNDTKIDGWKKTTGAEGGFDLVSPSPVPLSSGEPHSGDGELVVPRELTTAEIKEYAQSYSKAASNAIEAGFEGVEVPAANGYIPDHFLQTISSKRTGEYMRSVDNRVHFPLEEIDAVVETIGAPWSKCQDMGMKDPLPAFTTFIEPIRDGHRNSAYIHAVEPRVHGIVDGDVTDENRAHSNEASRKIWGDRAVRLTLRQVAWTVLLQSTKYRCLVAFSRHFIATPDLPMRLREGHSLARYNHDTFYTTKAAA
ncbi:FMN-linked oxidoreductase [Lactarius deliciosus]|nr:FMN-linked oxidoreductase [Lactarius deliciosus]